MSRILIVEDELELARLLERELAAEGYDVQHAPTGATALRLFREHEPDVLVLDWMLPDVDGLEVLRQLRRDSAVPVLMLTARAEEVDRVVGLELGADDYLTKPFGMRELVARVRALLRRQERLQAVLAADRAPGTAPLRVGPLRLDPNARSAALDGEPLDLSHTEFDLLHLLARNRGRAFSRAYLREALRGDAHVEGDRSVDNTILRLRKKLGHLGRAVETVWGIGYRFSAKTPETTSP
ncbi:MAG TPA: response regulator transcription factor [Chloroflexota bacterium]|nr:response regulator transcription factor [Chloroflexota bacterium]